MAVASVVRVAMLLPGLLALAGCERETSEVTAYDRSILVRAGDLHEFGWGYGDPTPLEKVTKHVAWDGSYTLEYEFETPDAEVGHPLYLGVFVTVARTTSDAVVTQQAERVGMGIGLGGSDIESREVPGFYPGARFQVLESGGRPVGNLFSLREGRKVYTLVLSGFYFDDPAEWKALVGDKLRRFAAGPPPARPH
jgi:hypothetical protein